MAPFRRSHVSWRLAYWRERSLTSPMASAAVAESEVIDKLRRAQVDTLSPIEALNLLYELKQKLD